MPLEGVIELCGVPGVNECKERLFQLCAERDLIVGNYFGRR